MSGRAGWVLNVRHMPACMPPADTPPHPGCLRMPASKCTHTRGRSPATWPGLDHRHFDKIKQYLGETLQEMGVKQVGRGHLFPGFAAVHGAMHSTWLDHFPWPCTAGAGCAACRLPPVHHFNRSPTAAFCCCLPLLNPQDVIQHAAGVVESTRDEFDFPNNCAPN